ncbi:serine protease [Streptomyces nogalater]
MPQREDTFGDRSGDLALLRLATPLPAEHTTRLHRLAAPHGPVSMYGFPHGDDGGRWHGATLVAARGRDSQVQLRPLTPGELAAPGFSGGGVVDHATDRVIGIVLSVDRGPGSAFSYMSPTETILSHLPQAAAWSDGAEAVDPRLRTGTGPAAGRLDVPFATELARWFRGEGWPVLVTVVPAAGDRAFTLQRAVTLADRELRTHRNTSAATTTRPRPCRPRRPRPRPGGRGTDHRRGHGPDRRTPRHSRRPRPERLGTLRLPLAAVLAGVDEAAEPDALLGLLDRLARQGARLLLAFRAPGERAARAAELLVHRPLRDRWARLHTELDRITEELGPALDTRRDRILPGPGTRPLLDRAEAGVRRTRMLRAWVAHTPTRSAIPPPPPCCSPSRTPSPAAGGAWRTPSACWTPGCAAAPNSSAASAPNGRCAAGRRGRRPGHHGVPALRGGAVAAAADPCDMERAETAVERFVGFCSTTAPKEEGAW